MKWMLALLMVLVLSRAGDAAAEAEYPDRPGTGAEERVMTIRIGERGFSATLADNDTARAFAALLPMELSMTELNGNEKYHYLMGPLPSAPERVGHIEAGDIMLFGDNCVVVFYQSFDTPYSYTRIGKIHDAEALAPVLGAGDVGVRFGE